MDDVRTHVVAVVIDKEAEEINYQRQAVSRVVVVAYRRVINGVGDDRLTK